MENQIQKAEFTGGTEIGKTPIGRHKYEYLKSIPYEILNEEQKNQISQYENKNRSASPEQIERTRNYLQSLLEPKEKKVFSITARELWLLFKSRFQLMNNKAFEISRFTIKNIEPIIYYFSKDQRFFECENLKKELSAPSFDKGLMIIGNYGNGKTSMMKVFESIFKGNKDVGFKGYSANEVVTMFEKCSNELAREDFENIMLRGTRYFDDLKTERIASNFGKVNIFKEIIEERYNRKLKTHITCNFSKEYPNDLKEALDEFADKYEGRVYDRIFEMFNIVEFKGKSFRK